MKRKTIIPVITSLSVFVSLLLPAGLKAQMGETKMTISYAVAAPQGAFKDFISNTTGRSADLGILYGINDKIAVGGGVGFADFYEKLPRQVYKTSDGGDISAVLTNTTLIVPVTARIKYNFMPGANIQPFLSAGLGGAFVRFSQYIGEYVNTSVDKVAFTARPGAGVYIPFGKQSSAGINLAIAYHIVPFDENYNKNLNYASILLGVSFPLRD